MIALLLEKLAPYHSTQAYRPKGMQWCESLAAIELAIEVLVLGWALVGCVLCAVSE